MPDESHQEKRFFGFGVGGSFKPEQPDRGSVFKPLHGERNVKMYIMDQSDVDLIVEYSRNGSIGGAVFINSLALIAAAYWDVLNADLSGPNAKLYFGLVSFVGLCGLAVTVFNLARRHKVIGRIESETDRYVK